MVSSLQSLSACAPWSSITPRSHNPSSSLSWQKTSVAIYVQFCCYIVVANESRELHFRQPPFSKCDFVILAIALNQLDWHMLTFIKKKLQHFIQSTQTTSAITSARMSNTRSVIPSALGPGASVEPPDMSISRTTWYEQQWVEECSYVWSYLWDVSLNPDLLTPTCSIDARKAW